MPSKENRMMRDTLDAVLNQFRPGFDADGFDIAVDSVGPDGVVIVRIDHRPNACEECLIPDDMLGPMLKSAMRRVVPDIVQVELRHEGVRK
jgi:Fe-S cluster biogenesis protein NfuA